MTTSPADLLARLSPADRKRADGLLASLAGSPRFRHTPDSFGQWLVTARPEYRWDYRHFLHMQKTLDAVTAGTVRRVYFSVPIRHGKLLADGTPMLTTRGWVTHGELLVGDEVFHPSGGTTRITHISRRAAADVRVELNDGSVFYCHERHEWTVWWAPAHEFRTVETSTLMWTERARRRRVLKSGGKNLIGLPRIQPLTGVPACLPVAPYTLGAWLGDGTTSKAWITHAADDEAVIDRVKADGYAASRRYVHRTTGVISTAFTSGKPGTGSVLHEALKAAGVMWNKHIPAAYLTAPIADRLQLLAGLIDTDGHIAKGTGRVRVVTADRRLAGDIVSLVATFGWRASLGEQQPCRSSSGIQGTRVVYSVGFQPTRPIPTVLERKKTIRLAKGDPVAFRSIEMDPCGKVGRCITVDAPDGLYLAGRNLTPTHNSESNTISFGAYQLERNPHFRLLLGSYNQKQANKFSRSLRRLLKARGVPLSAEKDGAEEWETEAGGGLRAVGSGSGVASVNADGIILDDPLGSRDDAESEAERDRVWDWITNDLLARCEPHTWVMMTGSRWHQDDPGGRIIDGRAGPWHVVDLPAEAIEGDPLGRGVGEPLWPELRGSEWLAEKRMELGAYGFASLLQGRPQPRGGGMFKWDWWKLASEVPTSGTLIRYWDTAGTDADGSNDPDYTAGVLMQREPTTKDKDGKRGGGRTFILDVAHFRFSVGQRDAEIERVARADLARYGGRVRWWFEQETGIGGKDRSKSLQRMVQNVGLAVSLEPATGDKLIRAEPLASAAEAGNIYLGPGEWRDGFRREAAEAPTGKHDDRWDAAAGAYNKLANDRPYLA